MSSKELADLLKAAGVGSPQRIVDLVQKVIWDELREEFIRLLESDTPIPGGKRKLMGMSRILDNYDQAVRNLKGQK